MSHPLPEPEFLYVGGDPALDLVNTVDWTADGPRQDRLGSFAQLTRWAEGAGVLQPAAARHLRRAVEERPRAAAGALAYAQQVRETLHDLFGAIARGESAGPALSRFNRVLGDALAGLEVAPGLVSGGAAGYQWRWRGQDTDPKGIVWPVLWSAASLLRSEELAKVRVCGGDDCGWMYVDRSRNGLRRWCQMRTCGTREKSRRRREGDPVS